VWHTSLFIGQSAIGNRQSAINLGRLKLSY
jgi:hypothetical protein